MGNTILYGLYYRNLSLLMVTLVTVKRLTLTQRARVRFDPTTLGYFPCYKSTAGQKGKPCMRYKERVTGSLNRQIIWKDDFKRKDFCSSVLESLFLKCFCLQKINNSSEEKNLSFFAKNFSNVSSQHTRVRMLGCSDVGIKLKGKKEESVECMYIRF